MQKIPVRIVKRITLFILCTLIIIFAPILAMSRQIGVADTDRKQLLTVWQIDSFEGGKGSRASYLHNLADKFAAKSNCYFMVMSISANSAVINMENGNIPDIISYGAGICGLESYIIGKTPFYTWCNGGYCFLTLDTNSDFSDINSENTVINIGTGNLSGAAALLCGLSKADTAKPTAAYVQLINGKYKYMLGTQRDIFRLKTRGAAFSVKPVEAFNDLYQNISITTNDPQKMETASNFIQYLLNSCSQISKIGLMSRNVKLYDDEMSIMEGVDYNITLKAPISQSIKNEINSAIINCDENKLKNLLK